MCKNHADILSKLQTLLEKLHIS